MGKIQLGPETVSQEQLQREACSHDSIATRAFWLGYIQSKMEDRKSFIIMIPDGLNAVARELVAKFNPEHVDLGTARPTSSGALFCRLTVAF